MNTVFDLRFPTISAEKMIYEGQLVVCSPTSGSLPFIGRSRDGEKAFAPLDPIEAHTTACGAVCSYPRRIETQVYSSCSQQAAYPAVASGDWLRLGENAF